MGEVSKAPFIQYLDNFRETLRNSDKSFLDEKDIIRCADEIQSLKYRNVLPLTDTNPLITVFGPKIVLFIIYSSYSKLFTLF